MNPQGPLLMRISLFCFFLSLSLSFFFKASPEADVLSSIQTQLQMKRKNIGGQSLVRWRKNEDLRGGKKACEGNKKKQMRGTMKTELVRDKNNKDVRYRTHRVK